MNCKCFGQQNISQEKCSVGTLRWENGYEQNLLGHLRCIKHCLLIRGNECHPPVKFNTSKWPAPYISLMYSHCFSFFTFHNESIDVYPWWIQLFFLNKKLSRTALINKDTKLPIKWKAKALHKYFSINKHITTTSYCTAYDVGGRGTWAQSKLLAAFAGL